MGNSCNYCEHILRFQRRMPKVTNRAIHLRMFAVVLTTFSAPPQILAASTVFSFLPNSRNEEMTGDGFLGATAAGLF